jgi:hypothetical protein
MEQLLQPEQQLVARPRPPPPQRSARTDGNAPPPAARGSRNSIWVTTRVETGRTAGNLGRPPLPISAIERSVHSAREPFKRTSGTPPGGSAAAAGARAATWQCIGGQHHTSLHTRCGSANVGAVVLQENTDAIHSWQ